MTPLLVLARRAAAILRSTRGAFDMMSVLAGAAVVAILVAGTLTNAFGVIPWAQDNGAKQSLSAASTAQGVAKVREGRFLDNTGLSGASYLNPPSSLAVGANAAGSCWVGFSRSDAGKTFYSTSDMSSPQPFTSGLDTGCVARTDQRQLAVAVGTPMPQAKGSAWGRNNIFKLGYGGGSPLTPVKLYDTGALAGKSITKISAGFEHSCAVADGAAYCWGGNYRGELGNGTTVTTSMPSAVNVTGVLAGKTVTDISAGRSNTCAVADGAVYCWGQDFGGQLGIGDGSTADRLVPAAVSTAGALAGKTVTAVSLATMGGSYCAIADQSAYCWGWNSNGTVGNGNTITQTVPVAVRTDGPLGGKKVSAIAAGESATCAIADGAGFCWGNNSSGVLGDGTITTSRVPVSVTMSGALAGKTLTAIGINRSHACGLAGGAVYCWGANTDGRLGTGDTTPSRVPVAVAGGLAGKSVSAITVGGDHTCAVAESAAYCWGANADGQLGSGNTTSTLSPALAVSAGVLSGRPVLDVSAGLDNTFAIYE